MLDRQGVPKRHIAGNVTVEKPVTVAPTKWSEWVKIGFFFGMGLSLVAPAFFCAFTLFVLTISKLFSTFFNAVLSGV